MPSDPRFRRPELPRDHALRDFQRLWGSGRNRQDASGADRDRRRPEHPQQERPRDFPWENPLAEEISATGSVIEEGVRTAYRVIDSYCREAETAARRLGSFDYPQLDEALDEGRFGHLQSRWLKLSSDMLANWFDLAGLATEAVTAYREPARHRAEPQETRRETADREPSDQVARVRFEVRAARPVSVSADLRPGAHLIALASNGLTALGDRDRFIDVELQNDYADQRVVVRLTVHDEHHPGVYTGTVVNANTGAPIGSIHAQVG